MLERSWEHAHKIQKSGFILNMIRSQKRRQWCQSKTRWLAGQQGEIQRL